MAGEWWLSKGDREIEEEQLKRHAIKVRDKSRAKFAEQQGPIVHKGGRQPSAVERGGKPKGLLGRLMPRRGGRL